MLHNIFGNPINIKKNINISPCYILILIFDFDINLKKKKLKEKKGKKKMYIGIEALKYFFETLKFFQDESGTLMLDPSVLIYCSADIDAICAAEIFKVYCIPLYFFS